MITIIYYGTLGIVFGFFTLSTFAPLFMDGGKG